MKRRNKITITLVLLIFVFLCIVLTGCQHNSIKDNNSKSNPLDNIKSQLESNFSFSIAYEYMNLAINGMSQQLEQQYGKDGSFCFFIERRQWDHRNSYEYTEKVEYYYQYENETFVCYTRKDDTEVNRIEVSEDELKAMSADKLRIVGYDVLFPSYLENFSEEISGEKYTFSLPVSKVLEGDSFLSVYLNNVFSISGNEYDPSLGLNILCTCKVKKDSYCPMEISYDFSEIKPYVLSDGALSGEEALDSEFMHMVFEFDYALPQTIEVPDEFLESSQ